MHSILMGSLAGISLYVHLPFSKNLTLLMSDRFSREMASREPSLLLSSSSFHNCDWTMPPFPLSVIILRPLPAKSSLSVQFPAKVSTPNIIIKQLTHNYSLCSGHKPRSCQIFYRNILIVLYSGRPFRLLQYLLDSWPTSFCTLTAFGEQSGFFGLEVTPRRA